MLDSRVPHHTQRLTPVRAVASSGTLVTLALAGIVALSASCTPAGQEASTGGTYDDLLALFDEWRAFAEGSDSDGRRGRGGLLNG